MVTSLTGPELPQCAVVQLAGRQGHQVKLTSDNGISVSGESQQESLVRMIRSLAFGFYPLCVESDAFPHDESFEGIFGAVNAYLPVSRRSVVVEILVPNLFCLPLFQFSVLEAAKDSLTGHPFFEPLSREQFKLAETIQLRSGDYLVIASRGGPACLALRPKQRAERVFVAELIASNRSIDVDCDELLVANVNRTITGTSVSISAEIARVSEVEL